MDLELPGGRRVRLDPVDPPLPGDLCVLTWNEAERVAAVEGAVRQGVRPRVVALAPILGWLRQRGDLDGQAPPFSEGSLTIHLEPYRPVPWVTPLEGAYKGWSAARDPVRAARRVARRVALPSAPPAVVEVGFPDGRRLVHLNLALHRGTDPAWLDAAAARYGGADWVVCGFDHGHAEALLARAGRFRPGLLVVADLVNEVRRSMGVPVDAITPVVDRLRAAGLPAVGLASRTALRLPT